MHSLRNDLLKAVELAIQSANTRTVSVALSGGLDSMVMLHICALLMKSKATLSDRPVRAIHINHGISQHAADWQAFCAAQCKDRDIPFFYKSCVIQKQHQVSLEAEAREARYTLIEEYAADTQQTNDHAVLLAQHQDDQAETFLLQLQRGAGTKGLSGMGLVSNSQSGLSYLRPLLHFSREQLATFARSEKLAWVEDESNTNEQYARNFVRHSVIPLLQSKWPQINKTIARSAHNCNEAEFVIQEYMLSLRERLLKSDRVIKLTELKTLSAASQASFLRYWLSDFISEMPSQAQLRNVLKLTESDDNKTPQILLQDWCIEKFQGCLHLTLLLKKSVSEHVLNYSQDMVLTRHWQSISAQQEITEQASIVSIALAKEGTQVHYGGSNFEARFSENRPTKKMKVWFQEWGVSPMQRKQTPILVYKDKVLAVLLENGQVKKTLDSAVISPSHTFMFQYSENLG